MSIVKVTTPQELIKRGAPKLFTTTAKAWTEKLVTWFETDEGGPQRTLFPAQVEMVFIHLISHAMSLLGVEAQFASEQRWLLFATKHNLDVAAANNSTFRLKASAASSTLRFTLSAPNSSDVFIAKGTRIGTAQGSDLFFQTDDDLLIVAGDVSGDITAHANQDGVTGNGYTQGEINKPIDQIHADLTVANTDTSSGGADEEDDDSLRFRAMSAHDRISKAGPIASYKQQVRAFSPSIVDVDIVRPEPGHIWIYPLLNSGAPSASILAEIAQWMTPLEKRPQGDDATVKVPEAVLFSVSGTVRYLGDPAEIEADVKAAIEDAATIYSTSLGDYLAVKTLSCGAGNLSGVVDLDLTISGPVDRQLQSHQFGVLTTINLTMEAANV